MTDALKQMLNQRVVIDTNGPIVYLGTLKEITEGGYTLVDADVHDCREGHATKEVYIAEAARDEIAVNRKEVVVCARYAMSISKLCDVVTE